MLRIIGIIACVLIALLIAVSTAISIYGSLYYRAVHSVKIVNIEPAVLRDSAVADSFVRTLPDVRTYLSDHSAQNSEVTWNAIAGIHERYIIILKVKVRLSGSKIVAIVDDGIDVLEVATVANLTDGRLRVTYGERYHRFASQWDRFVECKQDLSVLGVSNVLVDQPVNGFAEALKRH